MEGFGQKLDLMVLDVFSNLRDSVIPSIFDAELLILLVPTLDTIWLPALWFAKPVQRRVQMVLSGAVSALGNASVLSVESQQNHLRADFYLENFKPDHECNNKALKAGLEWKLPGNLMPNDELAISVVVCVCISNYVL